MFDSLYRFFWGTHENAVCTTSLLVAGGGILAAVYITRIARWRAARKKEKLARIFVRALPGDAARNYTEKFGRVDYTWAEWQKNIYDSGTSLEYILSRVIGNGGVPKKPEPKEPEPPKEATQKAPLNPNLCVFCAAPIWADKLTQHGSNCPVSLKREIEALRAQIGQPKIIVQPSPGTAYFYPPGGTVVYPYSHNYFWYTGVSGQSNAVGL